MFTKQFWLDLAERAIRTFVQALAGAILASAVTFTVTGFDWSTAFIGASTATVLSVAMSLAGGARQGNDASLRKKTDSL